MTEKTKQDITISVISHNQKNLVESLLKSLEKQNTQRISKIIITSNTNENLDFKKFYISEKIILIKNKEIKGNSPTFRVGNHCPVMRGNARGRL